MLSGVGMRVGSVIEVRHVVTKRSVSLASRDSKSSGRPTGSIGTTDVSVDLFTLAPQRQSAIVYCFLFFTALHN